MSCIKGEEELYYMFLLEERYEYDVLLDIINPRVRSEK